MTKKIMYIVALSLEVLIGAVLFVFGIIKHEVVLYSPGLVMVLIGIKSIVSQWKLNKGDKDELDKYRAAKDERVLMIWDKAATVGFSVAFVALMVTAFIYLIVLDMFYEGLVVFAILIAILISYCLAAWYYSKKL